jgi:hypothetical protein
MQRVRIGLTGLAFVFLLVALGAAISRWGANDGAGNDVAQVNGTIVPEEPTEPLAELGVAPGESSAANEAQNEM